VKSWRGRQGQMTVPALVFCRISFACAVTSGDAARLGEVRSLPDPDAPDDGRGSGNRAAGPETRRPHGVRSPTSARLGSDSGRHLADTGVVRAGQVSREEIVAFLAGQPGTPDDLEPLTGGAWSSAWAYRAGMLP
jgi:hypothetical protein